MIDDVYSMTATFLISDAYFLMVHRPLMSEAVVDRGQTGSLNEEVDIHL